MSRADRTPSQSYTLGFSHGSDASGMLSYHAAWPAEADFANPDACAREYMRGYSDGDSEKQCRGMPLWAIGDNA
jgi:hypothetical protein